MAGESSGGSASFNTSFTDINTGLFGTNQEGNTSQSGTSRSSGTIDEQLKIDKEGILKLITDALGGEGGLAEIFGKASASGIYNSTVAKQESGDLIARIAGELAKVTGVKTTTKKEEGEQTTAGTQSSESDGLFDNVFSGGGGLGGLLGF